MRCVCKKRTERLLAASRRRWSMLASAVVLAGPATTTVSGAATSDSVPRPDQPLYTLWNPTPTGRLRDLAADRPDRTESPITVDAGHFQLEMDLFTFAYDQHNPERSDVRQTAWSVGPVNLKLGLLDWLDAQLILEPYVQVRTEDRAVSPTSVTRQSGYGDTSLRAKINLWGNNGGGSAMAFLPFAVFPTSQDNLGTDGVQGGFILPFSVGLPWGFEAGAQTGFEWARDAVGPGGHAEFVNSGTLSRALTQRLAAYIEFWSLVSTERNAPWQGSFDFGFTYLINENLRLDAGLNRGVTRATEDWMPFLGLTWRH